MVKFWDSFCSSSSGLKTHFYFKLCAEGGDFTKCVTWNAIMALAKENYRECKTFLYKNETLYLSQFTSGKFIEIREIRICWNEKYINKWTPSNSTCKNYVNQPVQCVLWQILSLIYKMSLIPWIFVWLQNSYTKTELSHTS